MLKVALEYCEVIDDSERSPSFFKSTVYLAVLRLSTDHQLDVTIFSHKIMPSKYFLNFLNK